MSYSMCPYCNQRYLKHENHNCKSNDSFCSRSATNYDFQTPIQEQTNIQEISLSKEFHDPSCHIGNVSYELFRQSSVLQDQATFDTNPANRSDGPAPTLPSFQSTFSNNRLWKVNQEIPLSPPDRTYEMSNRGENIPFICGVAPDTFIPDESQDNSGEANNCRESFDGSCDIQSAILLNRRSEVPNEEGLPEDISFAFQPQMEIETRDTKTRLTSENSLDNNNEVAVSTHSRLKKHSCLDCGKRFICKSKLEKHSVVHSQTRQAGHICLVCLKEFRDKYSLERHSVVHSGEKRFTCVICKKGFTQKGNLKRHKVTHTKIAGGDVAGRSPTRQDERTCRVCGKEFPNKSELEKHSVVHSVKKPYNCDICKKGFTQKGNLKRHKVTHTQIAGADVAGRSRTRQDERTCQVCVKEFRDKSALERHSVVHSGIKPFNCDICKKGFTQKGNLNRHKLKHQRIASADNVFAVAGPSRSPPLNSDI